METSIQTFIVGGTFAVLTGLLLGFPIARERMAAPSANRHLMNAHLEALISGAVLLGLALAAGYSTLAKGWELTAAWLLIAGVFGSIAGGLLNWLQDVEDTFASKPPGFLLQSVSGPLMVIGGIIIAIGVLKGI